MKSFVVVVVVAVILVWFGLVSYKSNPNPTYHYGETHAVRIDVYILIKSLYPTHHVKHKH